MTAGELSVWGFSLLPIALTVLSRVRSPRWWIRLWDYPRLQVGVVLAVALALQLAFLPRALPDLGLLAVTLACLAWQVWRIWPYTPLAPVQVTAATARPPSARAAAAPAASATSATSATSVAPAASAASAAPSTIFSSHASPTPRSPISPPGPGPRPEVEPDRDAPASRAERPDQALSLMIANVLMTNRRADDFLRLVAEADPDIVLAVETDRWWDERIAVLQERYPWAVRHPLENTYGMHLFSRLELSGVALRDRVTEGIPSIFAQVRLRSGQVVDLHCVHPEPPQVGNDVEERDAELLLVAREVARDARPTIVCGDLNDVAWSHTTRLFQRISGLLDPRVGRGLFPTFHAGHWFARWPLDHVFHDASFRLELLRTLGYYGSDHFPVHVRLVHDPQAVRVHEEPEADAEDRLEAAEKIAEAR